MNNTVRKKKNYSSNSPKKRCFYPSPPTRSGHTVNRQNLRTMTNRSFSESQKLSVVYNEISINFLFMKE